MDIATELGRPLVQDHQLILVSPDLIDNFWPTCSQHFLQGKEHWIEFSSLEDIKKGIEEMHSQLWVATDEAGPHMTMLTEINDYPSMRTLRLLYIGGSHFRRVKAFLEFVELWASRHGVTKVELLGREAWIKVLFDMGYDYKATLIEKDISDIKEH